MHMSTLPEPQLKKNKSSMYFKKTKKYLKVLLL